MHNFGTYLHNPASCGPEASILATGLGRSGTTMVSRVLSKMGVFMGYRLTPMSHEDKDFQTAIKNHDRAEVERLCRDRDLRHTKWGFKCPGARNNITEWTNIMRNPRVIITFRDPLAISLRNALSMKTETLDGVKQAAAGTLRLIEETGKLRCPVLFISYEKALQFPVEAVATIATFCGTSAGPEVASVVRNSDPTYLGEGV